MWLIHVHGGLTYDEACVCHIGIYSADSYIILTDGTDVGLNIHVPSAMYIHVPATSIDE